MRNRLDAGMSLMVRWNFGRAMTVATVICSWLVISNHCAFGAIASPVHETESACPFHSKPARSQPPLPGTQCCKTLRGVVPVVTKSWARDDAKFSNADLYRVSTRSSLRIYKRHWRPYFSIPDRLARTLSPN